MQKKKKKIKKTLDGAASKKLRVFLHFFTRFALHVGLVWNPFTSCLAGQKLA